ncbi:MAG: hypothetical protein CFH34_00415 [Alphaproteobacteria bacterium MarineAlpha9_Bin4]|nr:hypothetical protein [Pelagibacterales bacterium]PPR27211.1 MAG: hypothetical protein CFH34_00415 [Alphaproteobacteria bacterium MarineAlpha9_Bin4]|tara:strand:- start:652 stop:903 length:252 start_codon:yes stop_codon:yes gene_type:complete
MKKNLLSDFTTVAGGILKSFEGAKDYSKIKLKEKILVILEDLDFIRKDDFEEMKAILIKSRAEIKKLERKVANIEKKYIKTNK